ncbi:MAG: DNA repair protein RecN [Alphaproteobacteria bacterium]|nr:DNA repair protein RecN [Alphaproteobacteria bacterium]
MLTRLSVRNIVLIDKLDLDFESGLTVFTGETGAGKSILLDALSLALGMRADSGLVRQGQKEASVTAVFSVPITHPAGILLTAHGYDFTGEIIVRRVITADGRSRAFMNDEPVSIGFLKNLGDNLVEIHGQFASHKLLDVSTHLNTLDTYASLSGPLSDCRHAFEHWQYQKRQRDRAEQSLLQAQKEESYLRESVRDLEKLNPQPNEEEILVTKRTRLMNSEKIVTALNTAYAILSDDENGCLASLGRAATQLNRANDLADNTLHSVSEQIDEAITTLSDSAATIEKEMEQWGDVSELSTIDDRLFALRDMARKHHVEIAELPDLQMRLKNQLTQLELGEESLISLRKVEEEARLSYITCAERLSSDRHQAAKQLDMAVNQELPALKLNKATFKTDIQKRDEANWSETGIDQVSFLVSTNKGTPLAPIHKIASGGELARFMLALKVNLAMADETETLIFDEVDSGVGGATAAAVGARLKRLATRNQVLVVTHSPQVAAFGQAHLTVHKAEQDGQVITSVSVLTADQRRDEIARMLSGEKITDTARTMATELLQTGTV